MSEQVAAVNPAADTVVPVKVASTDAVISKKATVPSRSAPKWETEARDRVKAAIRRYSKPLTDLLARDANEAETRLLVTDFLCDGLGYDKYDELTMEYQVKGEFADYGVRIDKQLVAFIEVKRCTQKLGVKHLRQVQMYAVNEGVEWMILTNGQVWQVYHMTGGLPVIIDLALEVDLLGSDSPSVKTDALFYLSKQAFKKRLIDELWKARAATSPRALAQVLLGDVVIDTIRKEVRRQTGHNPDAGDLARILRDEVLRAEALI
ncbi:type I restriction enzyme HsdR N-terminal domain-containing protein [Streptosporangiaceae bacterium NEAU-GS5]|nr:type I restriction enzyme HsdR N-terminal domain-containing protein [Streptosporangiaceae bacterium NEAU-GS5]